MLKTTLRLHGYCPACNGWVASYAHGKDDSKFCMECGKDPKRVTFFGAAYVKQLEKKPMPWSGVIEI